jgi:DNA-binding phage protein
MTNEPLQGMSMIYFVELVESKLVKIGLANRINTRITSLRIDFQQAIRVIGIKEGGRLEEKFLHERFGRHSIVPDEFASTSGFTELFSPDAEIMAFAASDASIEELDPESFAVFREQNTRTRLRAHPAQARFDIFPIDEQVGILEQVNQLIAADGRSIAAIAREVDPPMSRQHLSAILLGVKAAPSYESIDRVLAALGCRLAIVRR